MRKIKNKKADINLSFGFIFSVILIGVFIFAAIYGIKFFMNSSKQYQIGSFYGDFQGKIQAVHGGSGSRNSPFKIVLPKEIKAVCFINTSLPITNKGKEYKDLENDFLEDMEENVFLYPLDKAYDFKIKSIKNLNMEEILKNKNPYCVPSDSTLLLSKEIYETTITVSVES